MILRNLIQSQVRNVVGSSSVDSVLTTGKEDIQRQVKELVAGMINDPASVQAQTLGSQIMLGITIMDVTEELSKRYSMPIGVYVSEVASMSAAERAGLTRGDIIVEFDGQPVTNADSLNAIKAQQTPGESVSMKIDRNGQELTLSIIIPQPTAVETQN